MILPLPATGTVGPENIVDTRAFKNILKSYDKAIEHLRPKDVSDGMRSYGGGRMMRSAQVFQSGSYTIALAENPQSMQLALSMVPEKVRPQIPSAFLVSFSDLYPDWPVAICCFDGDLGAPEPLLWWFKPKFPGTLFAPAIDGHDGQPPNPEAMVDRDHVIAFASYRAPRELDNQLVSDIQQIVPPEHQWLFAPAIVGSKFNHKTQNGDFTMPLSVLLDAQSPSYYDRLKPTPPPKASPSVYDLVNQEGAFT
jgi:hypothetical protein